MASCAGPRSRAAVWVGLEESSAPAMLSLDPGRESGGGGGGGGGEGGGGGGGGGGRVASYDCVVVGNGPLGSSVARHVAASSGSRVCTSNDIGQQGAS